MISSLWIANPEWHTNKYNAQLTHLFIDKFNNPPESLLDQMILYGPIADHIFPGKYTIKAAAIAQQILDAGCDEHMSPEERIQVLLTLRRAGEIETVREKILEYMREPCEVYTKFWNESVEEIVTDDMCKYIPMFILWMLILLILK